MILFYSKSNDYCWNDISMPYSQEDIHKLFSKTDAKGRKYTTIPLHAPGETKNGATNGVWKGISPPIGRHWRCSPSELDELDALGLVEWSSNGIPRKILYADEEVKRGKKMQDIWEFKDPQYPVYPTEKNLDMLNYIIRTSSNEGDIVLDCFCGSGTTLFAANQLNRRWIGIDESDVAINISKSKLDNSNDNLFSNIVDYKLLQFA
jgi:adenine-specific DNA-methyltransferase